MEKPTTHRSKLGQAIFNAIPKLATYIDTTLRVGDLKWNRTHGGFLDRTFGISRHSSPYLVLPALIAATMAMGVPAVGPRLWLTGALFIVVLLLLILVARLAIRYRISLRNEMAIQAGLVLIIGIALWTLGGEIYHEGIVFYRHFFILVVGVVSVSLLLCWFLTWWVWARWQITNNYDAAFTRTELFVSREKQIPLGVGRFSRALLTVIHSAPLQLLLLPAVVALFARRNWLLELTVGTLVYSYVVLAMGGLDVRLNHMWRLFRNAFFRGGTRLVSLIIIAVAAARLLGVSYITTVFDTTEGVVLALLLLSVYVLLWWYDYWINRLIAQELIQLLDQKARVNARIDYPIAPDAVATSVPANGRSLQIHGAARFMVLGSPKNKAFTFFESYAFGKLFQALSLVGFPGGKAVPSPRQIEERIFDFKSLAATILLALTLLVTWRIASGVQYPQLAVRDAVRSRLTVAELLETHRQKRGDQPALIVAASGGGTRAALYTAAVLEGLAKQDRLQDIVMGSGVSGGGAALAYFAGNRESLVQSNTTTWDGFFDTMSMPYIQDVINSTLEWRTVYKSRLGVLLSESFARRWKLAETRNQFGEIIDVGLILNTSIAGRFACNSTVAECSGLPLVEAERRFRKEMTQSDMAGGRLILTNLYLDPAFVPPVVEVGGPDGLPVIVDHPDTRLEVAAALNANFPPVFSNAAVDLYNKTRYWITDGGAVDNRGIEMPLYALRKTLESRYTHTLPNGPTLPAITMLAIDASGYSNTYTQDRGVGSLVGAGAQFASQQMMELLQSIRKVYAQHGQADRFRFIYLPMPLCMRKSGSFGTHWMLQPTIDVDLKNGERRSISGTEMVALLRVMHTAAQGADLSADAQAIMALGRKDERWHTSARKLGFVK